MDDEEKWCLERRAEVLEYLSKENLYHGQVSEWPAWDIYPYTSSWAIESHKSQGWVDWWVICGDHPTDYVSAEKIKEPRYAYKAIAENWLEICKYKEDGKEHPDIKINLPSNQLIEMLRSRAKTFLEWVANDENWQYEQC